MKYFAFLIALAIILHHYFKHRNDKHLTIYEKIFQINDIKNHESWALFFIGIGIGMNLFN